jgi:hypothetical protein
LAEAGRPKSLDAVRTAAPVSIDERAERFCRILRFTDAHAADYHCNICSPVP